MLVLLAGFILAGCQQMRSRGEPGAKAGARKEGEKQSKPAPPELKLRVILADPTQTHDAKSLATKYAFGDAVILASYQTAGNIENCGCSPVQLGGMPPRGALIAEVRKRQPTLTLDLGAIIGGNGSFHILKARYVLQAMQLAGYDAMGLGVAELALQPDKLQEILGASQIPYYSANAYVDLKRWHPPAGVEERYRDWNILPSVEPANLPSLGRDEASTLRPLAPPGFVWEVKDRRVGVVFLNFTGLSEAGLQFPGCFLATPAEWLEAWGKQEHWDLADTWVLAAEGYSAQIATVIKDYPQFSLILTGDSHPSGRSEERMLQPVMTETGATWLNTYNLGGYLGLVNIDFPAKRDERNSLVAYNLPVVSTFYPDQTIKELIRGPYHDALKQVFPEQSFEYRAAVIIEPEDCRQCHRRAYDIFKQSRHPHSLETLEEKGQKYNAECLGCHVVYDYGEDKMYPLQCISCHTGISYRHIGEAQGRRKFTQKGDARFTYEFCAKCHTPQRSTRFKRHFAEYVKKVRH